jgi:hypothetical protein
MSEYDSGSGATPQKRNPRRSPDDRTRYFLRGEEQLLQSISSQVPLPRVLNEICSALDFQIGNVVSLVTLPDDDPSGLAAEGVTTENDELLGFLEMYSSVQRDPTAEEVQLIERAKCLAAIAIKRHNEASHEGNGGVRRDEGAQKRVPEWSAFRN